MKQLTLLALTALLGVFRASAGEPQLSTEARICITCHSTVTPGIVEDCKRGRHAYETSAEGLGKPAAEYLIGPEEALRRKEMMRPVRFS